MHMSVQEIMDQIHNSFPPSRLQLMKLMRKQTVRQVIMEYMVKNNIDLGQNSTRVDDVTDAFWDKLHP